MAWPFTPLTTYVASTTPAIKADDLNAFQEMLGFVAGTYMFGDGSDGDAVMDGVVAAPAWATKLGSVYTMTRDANVNDLTVDTATLVTNGFRLYVNGTLTLAGTSPLIHNDGADGANATGVLGGAGGAAGGQNGSLMYGGNGGTGSTAAGPIGTPGTFVLDSIGGAGGAGGSTPAQPVPFAGGAKTPPNVRAGQWRHLSTLNQGYILGAIGGVPSLTGLRAGAGGGGGQHDGAPATHGGGGGGGGGIMVLAARAIVLEANATISCDGGDGGDPSGTGEGGGGGGGGGLFLTIGTLYEDAFTLTATAAGGSPGSGLNAVAGSAGSVLQRELFPVTY